MKALKTQGTITFPKKSSILEGNGWLVFIDASTVMKNTHCFQFPIWQGETKSDQKKKKKVKSLSRCSDGKFDNQFSLYVNS